MAGGFGTRLRPLTNNLPKPMVPLANVPIMESIVGLCKKSGIKDLTSLLYFQPESITKSLGDGKKFGVKIDYTFPDSDLGTAGSVAYALRQTKKKSQSSLVISGDVLTDIDLTKAMEFHKKKGAIATIVLTRVENPLSFGIVITSGSGRIVRFLEKPSWGEVFSDTINTGIYILEKKVLDFIPEGVEFDFSKDLFPLLLEKKLPLYGYTAEGYWKDVGSLEEYRQANMDILSGRVAFDIPGEKLKDKNVYLGEGSKVDLQSELSGSVVIGKGTKVEAGVKISNSIIGDNVTLEEGAHITDSVVWHDVTIGHGARLQENVVCNSTIIKEGAHLGEGAIVSDFCRIGRHSNVKANVKVWPYKEVDDEATLASSLIWADKWNKSIFSTYGVTGLANVEITPEFAAKLGAAYGASLHKGSIVSTSRDSHKTSRMINRAVMTGILSTGVNIHDYGVTPMPVVRYISRTGGELGGIHSRRSPFDPALVDMKFFDDTGMDLHSGDEKSIERLFYREDFARAPIDETGEISFPAQAIESYMAGFMSAINADVIREANFKIVIDYSFGSSTRIFPSILGKLNCECISLNANLDPSKVTRSAEEFEHSLEQLSTIVRSLNADIGFMLDAGAEKIFMVDDTGEIIDSESALSLVTLLALKSAKRLKKKGTIAVPVTASRAVDTMASSYGYKVKRTKTAPRGVMESALTKDVFFVGENMGGYIFPEFQSAFDGMFAIAKTLEMLAAEGVKPHKLLREIPPSFMIKDRVSCPWESKGMIMRKLAENSRGKKVMLIDGIRISTGRDWVIAYPSQTNSYFHVEAEATTEDKAVKLVSSYKTKISKWLKEKR